MPGRYAPWHDRLPAEGILALRSVTISVIVCAYNESQLLPACLHSLLAQTRPPDEILVVDNASTDNTGAVACAIPGVRVIDAAERSRDRAGSRAPGRDERRPCV